MKKRGIFVTMAIGLVAMLGSLTGCSSGGATGSKNFLTGTKDSMTFSAVSGVALLSVGSQSQTQRSQPQAQGFAKLATDTMASAVPEDDELAARIEQVNQYINIFEGMIGAEGLAQTFEKDKEYNDRTYQTMSTVTVRNMDGSSTLYVMYYDETPKSNESEDEEDGEDEETEETETAKLAAAAETDGTEKSAGETAETEEEEVESTVEGVMLFGGEEYQLFGETERETDELEVSFTATAADGTKIKVEQETESDEQSFKYTLFDAAGVKVSESKIEIETEDSEAEIKLTLTEEGKTTSFKFSKELDEGKTKIKIDYKGADGKPCKATVEIKEENGKSYYSYRFQDGSEKSMGRVDFDDDED